MIDSDGDPRFETGCPACGCEKYRRKSPNGFGFMMDRVCRECGCRYTVAVPVWAAKVAIVLGAIVMATSTLLAMYYMTFDFSPDVGKALLAMGFCFVALGMGPFWAGMRELRRPPEERRNQPVDVRR